MRAAVDNAESARLTTGKPLLKFAALSDEFAGSFEIR
jgi:hypothetical protein